MIEMLKNFEKKLKIVKQFIKFSKVYHRKFVYRLTWRENQKRLDIWPRNAGLTTCLIYIVVFKALFKYKLNFKPFKLIPKYKDILIIPANLGHHNHIINELKYILQDFIIDQNFHMIQLTNRVCIKLSNIEKASITRHKNNLVIFDNINFHNKNVLYKTIDYFLKYRKIDILLTNSGIPTNIESDLDSINNQIKVTKHNYRKLINPQIIDDRKAMLSQLEFQKQYSLESEHN